MKIIKICLVLAAAISFGSCQETGKQDNATHDADTMVIRENGTDNPTNAITTDTTRR